MKDNIGIRGPDGESPIKQDIEFNLAMSSEVTAALNEKCERVNQLESYCESVRSQAIREVEELKEIAYKLGDEVRRLRDILAEHDIDFSKDDFIEVHVRRKTGG